MASERQPVETTGRWWGEHLHRYNEALRLINPNDVVLDIACGTGFGTHMIAGKTKGKVIGGDIAEEAVVESSSRWKKENLEFKIIIRKLHFRSIHYFEFKIFFFPTAAGLNDSFLRDVVESSSRWKKENLE